jgi:murein DD-endopeptidase MepM/ murein hydrolase activator NlpD
LAGCVGAGLAAQAFATLPQQALPVETETLVLPVSDLANPTGHQIRGEDVYGAGAFGASRGGGARRHRGADYVSEPGELVHAPISGVVHRIGYAYRGDARYQYVELGSTDEARAARVLYVGPVVELGAVVRAGDPIGWAQDLTIRYPRGITNHVHVELKQDGVLADPAVLLPEADDTHDRNT